MRYFILSLLLLAPALLLAQPKTPITHADMWQMKRVGDPVISPDGKWAVFSVKEADYDKANEVTDLWLVPTDGSEPARRITSGKGGESSPAWSPDGSKIVFSAKREGDEKGQLYLLDLKKGGEAQRLTRLSSGAGSPQWSPDGSSILFKSTIYPEASNDSIQKAMAKAEKDRKVTAFVYDQFPSRYFDHWIGVQKTAWFYQATHPDSTAQQLLAGDTDFPQRNFQFGGSACFSPDGQEVLFTATQNYTAAAYAEVEYKLYQIKLGESKRLVPFPDSLHPGSMRFSSDGKHLYLTARFKRKEGGSTYAKSFLTRMDWPGQQSLSLLTAKVDLSISDFEIAADGKQLWFTADWRGRTRLYRYDLKKEELLPFAPAMQGSISGFSLAAQAKNTALVSWQSAGSPPEIFRVDLRCDCLVPLTSFNTAALANLDLPALLEIDSKTEGFKPAVHSFIVLPPDFDSTKQYPLWVVMHGGPHSAWMDSWHSRWNYHLLAKPGYVLLLTNYRGSTGYGEQFAQAIHLDPFKGPGDDILAAAQAAMARYSFIDSTQQVAGGASYGGHLAGWMQATTTHFKCLISHAGLINSYSQWATSDFIYHRELAAGGLPWEGSRVWIDQNPIIYIDAFKTPMLLTIGEKDYRVPINNTLEAWAILQRMQVPSRLLVFPNENHWVQDARNHQFFVEQMHAWIEKWLAD